MCWNAIFTEWEEEWVCYWKSFIKVIVLAPWSIEPVAFVAKHASIFIHADFVFLKVMPSFIYMIFEFFFQSCLWLLFVTVESFNKVINVMVMLMAFAVLFSIFLIHFEVFNRFKQVCKVDSMEGIGSDGFR